MEVGRYRKYCVDVNVKSDLHKYLIGRNGATVRNIRESTGARIVFPQKGDPNPNVIQVTGNKQQIELAKARIQKFLQTYENMIQSEMQVDPKHHRYFVGRGGEVCQAISEDFQGVLICFPKDGSSKVTLKGSPESIDGAKKYIEMIVNGLSKLSNTEVIIPQKFHREVIGYKGKKIQSLQRDYSVDIKFPEKNDDPNYVSPSREDGVKYSDIIIVSGRESYCEDVKKLLLLRVPKSEVEWAATVDSCATLPLLNASDLPVIAKNENLWQAWKKRKAEPNPEADAAILNKLRAISQDSQIQTNPPPPTPALIRPNKKTRRLEAWKNRINNNSSKRVAQIPNNFGGSYSTTFSYAQGQGSVPTEATHNFGDGYSMTFSSAQTPGSVPTSSVIPQHFGGGHSADQNNVSTLTPNSYTNFYNTKTTTTPWLTPSGFQLKPWVWGGVTVDPNSIYSQSQPHTNP